MLTPMSGHRLTRLRRRLPPSPLWSAALVRGEWLDFTIRVKWSSDPAVGWIKLWYRGRQVLQRYRMATLYPGSRNYLKLGLYRDAAVTPTGVVYHDDMRIWAP